MKLTTIWTLRGMKVSERFSRTWELWIQKMAHHMPRRLAYWVLIDQGVRHMEDTEIVPHVGFMDIVQRADKGY